MVKTVKKALDARTAVRERMNRLNAEAVARQARVEAAAVSYYDHADARTKALGAARDAELAMGRQVAAILDNGETVERAAVLLEVTPAEVRRVAKLARDADGAAAPAPASAAEGGETASVEPLSA